MGEAPRESGFEGQQGLIAGIPQARGSRNSTVGRHTQGPVHTRIQWEKYWPSKRLSQIYLPALEGLLWRQGWLCHTVVTDSPAVEALVSTRFCGLHSERLPFLPRTSPTQQPVDSNAGMPQVKQHQQSGSTGPPISRQGAWSLRARPRSPKGQSPASPTRKQDSDFPTRKPANLLDDLIHQRGQTVEARKATILWPVKWKPQLQKVRQRTFCLRWQMKEQDKTPEQVNEVEIGNVPEKEFREMIVKMTQYLRKREEWRQRLRTCKKCLTKI